MQITFDPAKREKTLRESGVDFLDAKYVFENIIGQEEDSRFDYAEKRIISFGYLNNRLMVVGYVQRGNYRHVFTMRKANAREQSRFAP